jgi:hypothetical protein
MADAVGMKGEKEMRTDKSRCNVCHSLSELAEGLSVAGVRQYARTCRTHGRQTLWFATRAAAEEAEFITAVQKAKSKHLPPVGAVKAKGK